jgi:hypothetical protein
MGLNPFRSQKNSTADYLMVAGAIIVTLGAIVWAIFAG